MPALPALHWLLACQALSTLAAMSLLPVMPLYVATLHNMQPAEVPAWSAAALAAPAVGTLLLGRAAGRCCDHYGSGRIIPLACGVFAAGLVITCLGQHPASLLLGRLLQGASVLGVALSIAAVETNAAMPGAALGRMEGATAIGALSGPTLGGLALQADALRELLLTCAGLMALTTWRFWCAQRRAPAVSRPPAPAIVGRSGASLRWLAALLLVQAAAFALVVGFALHLAERFSQLPGLPGWLGVLHAGAWAATLVAAPLWGHFNNPRRARQLFCVGAWGCATCLWALAASTSLWQVALLRLLLGACYAALAQSALVALIGAIDPQSRGGVIGSSRSVAALGQLLGPLLVTALQPWWSTSRLLSAVALLFAAAAVLSPRRPTPSRSLPKVAS
ncbi:MAG TPA: MFS transporter [Stenotrophomonas sp.]